MIISVLGYNPHIFFSFFFFFPLLLGKWNGMHGNIGFSRNPTQWRFFFGKVA